jgi:hypothetical protein
MRLTVVGLAWLEIDWEMVRGLAGECHSLLPPGNTAVSPQPHVMKGLVVIFMPKDVNIKNGSWAFLHLEPRVEVIWN